MSKQVLLGVVLLLFALYLPLDKPIGNLYQFKTFVDDLIILNTKFTVVYLSYFLFLVLTIYYLYKKDIIKRLLFSIVLATTIAYLIYIFFQNYIIRPEIVPLDFFDYLYVLINEYVPPYNAFPSLHVAISIICLCAFIKEKSSYLPGVIVWVVLICISTVLAKQHYFLDVAAGFGLGVFSFLCASLLLRKIERFKVK